jgi:hypothetical protein
MLRLLVAFLPTLFSAMRSRRQLVIENLALRQQLATMAGRRHPDIRPADRVFWVLLRRYWSRWAQALAIVEPDTVVRWHRAGFRIYWNWLSRRGRRSGRPPLPLEVRALIRRMATENPWGAPRIHGELLCLGFDVSERSISRYMRSLPRTPRANATWMTFLRNHRDGIAAMDFFTVPTAMFPVLNVFLVIRHGRRDVVRCSVTTSPTAAWVAQQLRETFPFESAPRFLIFDRDAIFSAGLTATIRSMLMAANAHQLPKSLAKWGRGEICWNRPPGTSRPRHRTERAPPAAVDRLLCRLLQRRPNASRGRQGLSVRTSGRAEAGRDVQRRQPPSGRRPASPLRMAPGGVGRFGPEVHLGPAAGSIGGRWSSARSPKASSIHAAGTTSGAPFPAPDALLHPASHAVLFTDRVLASHRRTGG